ncbi:MAG TPA: deoxyribose-phosphate aldolase [Bacteroidales bacterium]|nr:deoxyribose-phosphate aldolase [Bacteroidales bacterium]HQP03432.1 deoxyribose-phosphate aldolase [Bacteroidales bacterium]
MNTSGVFNESSQIGLMLTEIKSSVPKSIDSTVLKTILHCIDLTSLNATDTNAGIKAFTEKVNLFSSHFNMDNVAAICIYPSLVPVVKQSLADKNVKIASVAGSFPSSQTYLTIKLAECELAVNKGADELDIVISLGNFFGEQYQAISDEIALIKSLLPATTLKVILETGELKTLENIYKASWIAMQSGADFIKTSTGKSPVSATPEAVLTMCIAIRNYFAETGRKVGIKASGGIVTPEDAFYYYNIVASQLGNDWLNNSYFRIGASRLANNILTSILSTPVTWF